MRLAIRHVTAYRYSRPVAYAIQTLRLTPRPYDGLSGAALAGARRAATASCPPSSTATATSFTATRDQPRRMTAPSIAVEGEVETRRDAAGWCAARARPLPPGCSICAPTPLTAPDAGDRAPSRWRARAAQRYDRLLRADGGGARRVDYRAGDDRYARPRAAEALARGAGVCQDHAHLFIAAVPRAGDSGALCRRLSLGGRRRRQRCRRAMPGPKPSSRISAGSGSIPPTAPCRTSAISATSIGLDYWSAAPVRGMRRGVGENARRRRVKVARRGASSNKRELRGSDDDLLRRALLSRTGSSCCPTRAPMPASTTSRPSRRCMSIEIPGERFIVAPHRRQSRRRARRW